MSDQGVVPPVETVAPQPPAHNFFRGANGIRAGWRVLMFLMIVCGTLLVLAVAVKLAVRFLGGEFQLGGPQLTPVGTVSLEGTILFITVIPARIMARIERRRFGVYGLPARFAFRKDFRVGTLVGFLAISACLLGIFALHGFRLAGLAIHGNTIVTAVAAWSAAFVVVGLAEEFAFRGYLQYTLTTGMGFWPSAILLSLLFGLAHASNPGESRLGLLSVVLFGLLFCLFLRRTGNLWWAVGFHAGWDWGQTFFYGVPDSGLAAYHNLFNCAFNGATWLTGGSVGPEASVFTPIALALVAILFSRVYRERKYQTSH
jgi:membrane protease YdiL (CAAX protease family)